jgi:hypothetical protein
MREFMLDADVVALEVDSAHDELLAIVGKPGLSFQLNAYTPSGQLIRSARLGAGPFYAYWFVYSPQRDEVLLVSDWKSIVAFPRLSSGDVKPVRTLSLEAWAVGLVLDPVHDEMIVVLNHGPYWTHEVRSTVAVYSQTAEGTSAPLRVIDGFPSGAVNASEMVSDPAGGKLFVNAAMPASIAVYSGGDLPERSFPAQAFSGLAQGGRELFALNYTEVTVFSSDGGALRSFAVTQAENIAYDDRRGEIWLGGYGFAEVRARDGALLRTSVALKGFFGFEAGGVWAMSASREVISVYPADAQGDDPAPWMEIALRHPATGRPLVVADRKEIYVPVATGVEVYSTVGPGAPLRTLQGVKATRLAVCK